MTAKPKKAAPRAPHPPAPYTVRLHFAEPEELAAGQRVFSVALQGKTVLSNFDVVAAAGAPQRGVVKEFKGVVIAKDLQLTLPARLAQSRPARVRRGTYRGETAGSQMSAACHWWKTIYRRGVLSAAERRSPHPGPLPQGEETVSQRFRSCGVQFSQ